MFQSMYLLFSLILMQK